MLDRIAIAIHEHIIPAQDTGRRLEAAWLPWLFRSNIPALQIARDDRGFHTMNNLVLPAYHYGYSHAAAWWIVVAPLGVGFGRHDTHPGQSQGRTPTPF